jgi:hypothetical protein
VLGRSSLAPRLLYFSKLYLPLLLASLETMLTLYSTNSRVLIPSWMGLIARMHTSSLSQKLCSRYSRAFSSMVQMYLLDSVEFQKSYESSNDDQQDVYCCRRLKRTKESCYPKAWELSHVRSCCEDKGKKMISFTAGSARWEAQGAPRDAELSFRPDFGARPCRTEAKGTPFEW